MTSRNASFARELILTRIREELERLFQEITIAGDSLPGEGSWSPAVDILESSDELLVRVEVPGIGPDSLSVELEGSTLVLSGNRRLEYGSGLRFHCLERTEGTFFRRVQLLPAVDTHRAEVVLSGGQLEIRLPKLEDRRKNRRSMKIEEREENP